MVAPFQNLDKPMNELERNVREHSRARPRSDRIEIGQSGGHGGATSSKHARGVTSPPLERA